MLTFLSCRRSVKQDLLLHSLAPPALISIVPSICQVGVKCFFCFTQLHISINCRSCKAKNNQALNSSSPFSNTHPGKSLRVTEVKLLVHARLLLSERRSNTHPSVVMVTIVYQKEAGILVNLLAEDPFSA